MKQQAKKESEAKLVFTAATDSEKRYLLSVYRCEDGSVFCKSTLYGEQKFSDIKISVERGSVSSYKYHPSKKIYTGATVGGITMGGVHETKDYYTSNETSTDKGSISISYDGRHTDIYSVTLEPHIGELFKRDPDYKRFFIGNAATCRNGLGNSVLTQAALNASDYSSKMKFTGMAIDESKRLYKDCVAIAGILRQIIYNRLPETDEEMYVKALELSKSDDLEKLKNAVEIFEYIKDYKAAEQHLNKIKPEYEKRLQQEKERLVLEKEANSKKRKLIGIVALVLVVAGIVAGIFISKGASYNKAMENVASGEYDIAISAFEKLNGYKDSEEQIIETKYQKAVSLLTEDGDAAYALFKELGDYKESSVYLSDFQNVILRKESKKDNQTYYWDYSYDESGRLKEVETDELGPVTIITYEYENDRLIKETQEAVDKRSNLIYDKIVSVYSYSENGVLKAKEKTLYKNEELHGRKSIFKYDENGNVAELTVSDKDVVSSVVTYEYELTADKKVKKETAEIKEFFGSVTTTSKTIKEYDEFGGLITIKESYGSGYILTEYDNTYDENGNCVLSTDNFGNREECTYAYRYFAR